MRGLHHRLRWWWLAVAIAVATTSGCVGPGDMDVSLPALRLEGRVLDGREQAVCGETVRVALAARFYYGPDKLLSPALSGKAGPEGYVGVAEASTQTDGTFVTEFPGRQILHPVAVVGPFALGAGQKHDLSLLVAVGDEDPLLYHLYCHRKKVRVVRVLRQEDGSLATEKMGDPGPVSASIERTKEQDRLTVTLQKD